ncbi:hypothetical protein COTS27_00198 [Spirochaetota bacterium]|nr:hypothetical protein COTS27_00198 [Spirochaetota bacterium]
MFDFIKKYSLLLPNLRTNLWVLITLVSWNGYLWANEPEIFETPTALTLERGEFRIGTHYYDSGGLFFRAEFGASPYFNLGIVEYFDNLIGTNPDVPSIPNAYAKAKIPLPSGKLTSLDLAFGYDAIYRGNFKPFGKTKLYGIYSVLTLGFAWAPEKLYSPHYFSFGVRYPLIFKMDTPDAFFSLHLRFHKYFQFATELSNIHLGRTSRFRILNNNVIITELGYGITLKTTLQIAGIKTGSNINATKGKLGIAFALVVRNFF